MRLVEVEGEGSMSMVDDYTMGMFVPHLLSGFACMNFLSNFSCDLALVRGRKGCRPGAFLLYFGCRYLSILAMVFALLYYDVFYATQVDALNYLCQAFSAISLGLAFSIIAIRIATMYKNAYLNYALEGLILLLWALLLLGLRDIPISDSNVHLQVHVTMSVSMLLVSTSAMMLGFWHVLFISRHEHHYRIRDCFQMLWQADVAEFTLIWAMALPATIIFYMNLPTSTWHHFTVSYASFVVVTVVSCRIYRKILRSLDFCPIDKYSVVYGWIKISASYVGRKLGLQLCVEKVSLALRTFIPHTSHNLDSHSHRARHDVESTSVSLPMTVSGARPVSGRAKQGKRDCVIANSHSTYAHSSLYDSQAS